jgi:hypothetical protein
MRRLLVIAIALLAVGCITPSIPIPPPDPTLIDATLTDSGTASFTYPATAAYIGGVAEAYDRSIGHGSIDAVNANGSVGPTTPIAASAGDNIVFTIVNGDQTASTCVILRAGAQDPNALCL